MAFTVTPTSGAAPYVYAATFANAESFNYGGYSLGFASTTVSGSCPTVINIANNMPQVAAALLANGTYTSATNSVPIGSCRGSALFIRDLSTGAVIQQLETTISNV